MTRWLSADQIAAMLDKDPAAVYRLAYRRKWRRFVHAGQTFYDPAQVAATLPNAARWHATLPNPVDLVGAGGRS